MNRMIVCALALFAISLVGGAAEPDQSWRSTMPIVPVADRRIDRESPSGPIRLSYQMLGEPAIGQPVEVLIAVISSRHTAGLAGEVYGHDGLIVTPAGFSVGSLDAGRSAERILTVTPYLSGPLRFSVLVQAEVEGQTQAAQLSVAVDVVGSTAERTPPGTIDVDGSGAPIITLLARNRWRENSDGAGLNGVRQYVAACM